MGLPPSNPPGKAQVGSRGPPRARRTSNRRRKGAGAGGSSSVQSSRQPGGMGRGPGDGRAARGEDQSAGAGAAVEWARGHEVGARVVAAQATGQAWRCGALRRPGSAGGGAGPPETRNGVGCGWPAACASLQGWAAQGWRGLGSGEMWEGCGAA